jgi:hypothetical protein
MHVQFVVQVEVEVEAALARFVYYLVRQVKRDGLVIQNFAGVAVAYHRTLVAD